MDHIKTQRECLASNNTLLSFPVTCFMKRFYSRGDQSSKPSTVALGAFAKWGKTDDHLRHVYVCLSVRPSVRPHGTTALPLDGF